MANTAAWLHDGGANHNLTNVHQADKLSTHSRFYWGHTDTVVLFDHWPGDSAAMYALAVIFVFFLGLLVEFLSHSQFVKPGTTTRFGACLFKTGLYTVRAALSYMVILAVTSYNGGIYLAAVGGHAVGFLIFGTGVSGKQCESGSR